MSHSRRAVNSFEAHRTHFRESNDLNAIEIDCGSRVLEIRVTIRKYSLPSSTMPAVRKTTKKRPAQSQDGQKAKRARISKRMPSKRSDETLKKRRQPVTLPVNEINERDSDEEDEAFEDVESGDEDVKESFAKDGMDVDDGLSKDPNGPLFPALPHPVNLIYSILSH